jgi:hypothetical protein
MDPGHATGVLRRQGLRSSPPPAPSPLAPTPWDTLARRPVLTGGIRVELEEE